MLFFVNLTYQKPLAEVDAHLNAHRSFLLQHYSQGHFLASGPKTPRTGGVILAKADSLRQLQAWLHEDPFHGAGIATHEIVAWEPTLAAAGLASAFEASGAKAPS